MNLYNTLTQRIEPFTLLGETVSLYVCGITPYDTTHLGHAFTYTAADILVRYLESQGLQVKYVQNVTDIDDDIQRKAREVGDDWRALGNRWTSHFIHDMQALNVRPPDHYPRASDVIPEIVAMVGTLIERGLAYESGGNVYYHVDRWPGFGQLSHLRPEEMLPVANERGNRPDDPHKADPLDFVLWQAQAPGEPAWDSPWGPGRPGWHIECSTMSTHFIGPTLDLHSGGSDLIFPHHECEIAQSEGATGRHPFVRVWLHTAMVEHDGAKMSKSLGNLVMVSDLLQHWPADALRVYMGSHHYRKVWAYDAANLRRASQVAARLRKAASAASGTGPAVDAAALQRRFTTALENDLDSTSAMTALDELAAAIIAGAAAGQHLDTAQASLRQMSKIFGLRLDASGPEDRVLAGWDEHLKHYSD
jgi:cysteinyl-tRNA synthetase